MEKKVEKKNPSLKNFKKQILGEFNEKKELFLSLSAPLQEGRVAKMYCSRCGGIEDIDLQKLVSFLESIGIDKVPDNFFPRFYLEVDACGRCRTDQYPPKYFWLRSLNDLISD